MLDPAVRNRLFRVLVSMAIVVLSARGAAAAGGVVYALNQVNGGSNQIYGFRINPVSGALTLLSGFPVASGGLGGGGSFSEHMAYRNGLLFVVNEGSASLSVFSVDLTTGALTATSFSPIALGGDLACVAADPTAAPVVVGSNAGLWSIVITPSTATVASGSPFATPPGVSPFSCGFSRDGLYVYTGGNVGAVTAGFAVSPSTGVLTTLAGSPFNSGASNPVGYATDSSGRFFTSNFGDGVRVFTSSSGTLTGVTGNPFTSGLSGGVQGVLHPSGFYMVADRSANRVGVFQIAGSGSATTLAAVSGSPFSTGGTFTDAVTLAAGGAFLVAANGISRNLTTFQVNGATGVLTSLGTQSINSVGSTGLITGLTFAVSPTAAPGDFDGDGQSDITVYRPSTGTWFILEGASHTMGASVAWGLSTDTVAPRDYDGDGKIDVAVYRPSTGTWFIRNSADSSTTVTSFGLSTDVAVPGDYNGDGRADAAVWRPSTGVWYATTLSAFPTWGLSTDTPLPADYDGDGKIDPAVYRPSTGTWFILNSSTNFTTSTMLSFGLSTDVPVPADYDGDGKADVAVYRPSTGAWFILKSSDGTTISLSWGLSTDVPVPADYDGDGKADPSIFRPSTGAWFVLKSSTTYTSSSMFSWGLSTDTPINKRP